MSASLVGSEMCIRDSARSARSYATPVGDQGDQQPQGRSSASPNCQHPVSYTHLTLPTICSV
eukprot:11203953-Alexandrium_andersonii.AAC.1